MNFNRISAIAAVAFVAMPFALVACSDSSSTNVNEPVADADLEPTPGMSSGTECQGISIPEGFLCLQEACNAENEGQVIAAEHGNPKYGYQVLYAQCKQGSWTNVEPWAACDTAGVAVGDTCSEATFKGGFQFGGSTHAYYIYAGDGVWKEIEPVPADSSESTANQLGKCSSENEGLYETVIDTVTVYPDGKVWDRDVYYHCESGEWVETECRDPLEACAGNNEGEYQDVVCISNPGNPKASKTTWTFKCANNKWEKLSDEEKRQLEFEREMVKADATCNEQYQPEPKLGDVCGITKQGGNVSFGIVIYTLVCYVYTEKGWTYKGYDDWYDPAYAGTCEELLKAPDLEKECTDGESAERTVDDKVYHYICSSGEWQIHDIERPVFADPAEVPTDSDTTAE